MHISAKAETLRLFLRTAMGLRVVAAGTLDRDEADLFLRGAVVLETRARALAEETDFVAPEIYQQIDLRC